MFSFTTGKSTLIHTHRATIAEGYLSLRRAVTYIVIACGVSSCAFDQAPLTVSQKVQPVTPFLKVSPAGMFNHFANFRVIVNDGHETLVSRKSTMIAPLNIGLNKIEVRCVDSIDTAEKCIKRNVHFFKACKYCQLQAELYANWEVTLSHGDGAPIPLTRVAESTLTVITDHPAATIYTPKRSSSYVSPNKETTFINSPTRGSSYFLLNKETTFSSLDLEMWPKIELEVRWPWGDRKRVLHQITKDDTILKIEPEKTGAFVDWLLANKTAGELRDFEYCLLHPEAKFYPDVSQCVLTLKAKRNLEDQVARDKRLQVAKSDPFGKQCLALLDSEYEATPVFDACIEEKKMEHQNLLARLASPAGKYCKELHSYKKNLSKFNACVVNEERINLALDHPAGSICAKRFKPRATKFWNCYSQSKKKIEEESVALTNDPVAAECVRIGFEFRSEAYANCYLRLTIHRNEMAALEASRIAREGQNNAIVEAQRESAWAISQAARNAEAAEKTRREAEGLRQLSQILGGMASSGRRPSPSPSFSIPRPQRIESPSGRTYNCAYSGATLRCR